VRRAAAEGDKPNVVRPGFLVGGTDSTILRHGTKRGGGGGGSGAVDDGARDRRSQLGSGSAGDGRGSGENGTEIQ
jgi:hypothetical protein